MKKKSKKRVYKFECPNCSTTNQNHLLAEFEHGKRSDSLIICVKCNSRFSSVVLERVYYMGVQHGKGAKIINPDEFGHEWEDRGQNICPFKCRKCGVLSGTNKAFKKCQKRDARKQRLLDLTKKARAGDDIAAKQLVAELAHREAGEINN